MPGLRLALVGDALRLGPVPSPYMISSLGPLNQTTLLGTDPCKEALPHHTEHVGR